MANISFDHELLKRGQWVMPDSDCVSDVMGGIEYSTTNDRDADVINRALKAIGAPALDNGVVVCTCSRSTSYAVWIISGTSGCAVASGTMESAFLVVPLAFIDAPQGAAL